MYIVRNFAVNNSYLKKGSNFNNFLHSDSTKYLPTTQDVIYLLTIFLHFILSFDYLQDVNYLLTTFVLQSIF